MRLADFEPTIQTILDEMHREPKESAKQKVLFGWRSKLEKEPTRLPLYQIDEIVREVRRRLPTQHPTVGATTLRAAS